ncbi:Ig-like domain-containing protein [Gramella lutea]|uniref:Ig-like domain-containing protein n=1 Tax=Christiangramia lutea TaxID=1607951 RepID=A0A9X1V521_9FLAO|nr:Ig-like domain-containing protein [Christiangramia lutea]MCH4824206.1 Ig-like domain-containing protein [Christiangramia lutea]
MIGKPDTCFYNNTSLVKVGAFIIFLFFSIGNVFGQDPYEIDPTFNHFGAEFLSRADTEDTSGMVLAVDTDSQGNTYILTFGNGVYKYNNDTDTYINIISDELGDPGSLNAPLDLAIDSNDIIYIADSGSKLIKKFDTSGNSEGVIGVGAGGDGRNEFWQPTGLELDRDDNLFIVDAYRGDNDAVTERYFLKIYYADGTFRSWQGTDSYPLNNPYRVAANDDFIFISHSENNGETLVFNKQLEYVKTLENIGSTGSIFIDNFNYVYVIDYADRVELSQIFELISGNLGFFQLFALYNEINAGISDGDFKIQVYDPDLIKVHTINDAPVNSKPDDIQLPIDISLDACDKMYLIDGELDGLAIDFNLEKYNRTPSNDNIAPIARCVSNFELALIDGSITITVDDINDGSSDNCGIDDLSIDQKTFTSAGNYTVVLKVTDAAGNEDYCSVQITVTGEEVSNEAPTAVEDSYTVEENLTLNEAVPGVLENDTDPDDEALSAVLQTDVSNGTLNLNSDGSFTYTPDPNFTGPDSFSYVASDGELNSNVVTVSITVTPKPNETPTAVADSYTVEENQTLNNAVPGVLENDTDPDDDALSAVLQTDVSNGTLNLNSDGSFTYTPDPNYTGPDSFTYVASDGELNSNVVTVNITVILKPNEAPMAVADSYFTNENQTLIVNPGVLSNDSDPDGDSLTAVLINDVSNGTLDLNSDGTFTYIPNTDFVGQDAFTYVANDGEKNSNEVTVNITVLPGPSFDCPNPNDFEPIPLNDNCDYEVPDYTGSIQNPQNFEDYRVEPIYTKNDDFVEVSLEVYDGDDFVGKCNFTVPVEDNSPPEILNCSELGETVTINEGDTYHLADYRDLLEVDDCSDYEVTQDPEPDFSISQTTDVTITVTDDAGLTDTCTFTVEVNIENEDDLRITCPGGYEVAADENCIYRVPDFSTIVSTNIEGAQLDQELAPGSVFQPNTDLYVTVTATFEDQTVSCEIYLSPIDNEAPVARCINDIEIRLEEGETIQLRAEDFDDGSTDNCQIVSYNLDRTSLSSSDEGENLITFTVNDAVGNLDFCEVNVEVILEEPGDLELSCLIEEYDLFPNENCEYIVPDLSDFVDYSPASADFTQTISAGTVLQQDAQVGVTVSYEGETRSCNLYVSLQEDEPQAICVENYQITLAVGEVFSLEPEDLNNGSYSNCSSVDLSIDKTEFTSADAGFNTVTLSVTNALENTSTCETQVEVIVSDDGVNEPPVAFDEEYTTGINTTLNVSASEGVLVNDTDPENDELTAILDTDVEFGDLQLNPDGSFSYTPDNGFTGQDFFTYVANDGEFNSNVIFVSINVVDDNGEVGCNSRVILELDNDGVASLNLDELVFGNTQGLELSADKVNFSCDDIGENTVTLSYTGLVNGSCEVNVMVLDNIPPTLDLKEATININSNGLAVLSFDDIDNGSFDNCDSEIQIQLSDSSFTCKNLGENLVVVTAEDSFGNRVTANTTITVLDESGYCDDPSLGSEYIFIYPNPNTGSFKISAPPDEIIERIEVFDHRGRFIEARDYEMESEYSMELGPLQEAVYVLKIITNEKTVTKRMIFKY